LIENPHAIHQRAFWNLSLHQLELARHRPILQIIRREQQKLAHLRRTRAARRIFLQRHLVYNTARESGWVFRRSIVSEKAVAPVERLGPLFKRFDSLRFRTHNPWAMILGGAKR